MTGCEIPEATDIWQLTRAMHNESNPRRRVYARRRLIELGELVHRDKVFTPGEGVQQGSSKWLTKAMRAIRMGEIIPFDPNYQT
jgi:hypothetical protein